MANGLQVGEGRVLSAPLFLFLPCGLRSWIQGGREAGGSLTIAAGELQFILNESNLVLEIGEGCG